MSVAQILSRAETLGVYLRHGRTYGGILVSRAVNSP